jgi:hypothetical protein
MGSGLCLKKLTANKLAQALTYITTNSNVIERARLIGERIRKENGVQRAVENFYRDFELAANTSARVTKVAREAAVAQKREQLQLRYRAATAGMPGVSGPHGDKIVSLQVQSEDGDWCLVSMEDRV